MSARSVAQSSPGLCEAVEHPPQILLSPRNARRAAALAARYPSVSVAQDKQAVIDRCAARMLAIRPQDAPTILTGLHFQSDLPIISVIAGMSLNELAPLIAPAAQVARAIPLPQVARRTGVTPIHPDVAAARTLFDQLGGAITINEPDAFEAMSATTGTIAAHFVYVAAISRWLSSQGVAADTASRYVASIFAGLADTLSPDDLDLDALTQPTQHLAASTNGSPRCSTMQALSSSSAGH